MIIEEDVALEHFGVKGMHWGVRNDKSGGSSKPGAKKTVAPPKVSAKQQAAIDAALHQQRVEIGKTVATSVLITAGSLTVGVLATPMAGAAVGAVARTIVAARAKSKTTVPLAGASVVLGAKALRPAVSTSTTTRDTGIELARASAHKPSMQLIGKSQSGVDIWRDSFGNTHYGTPETLGDVASALSGH